MPSRDATTHALIDVQAQLPGSSRGSHGAVKAHTWKELVEQAEIAEKSAKKFEPSAPKGKRQKLFRRERCTNYVYRNVFDVPFLVSAIA